MSPRGESSDPKIVSVLFMDIIGYSLKSVNDQKRLLTILQTAVEQSSEFRQLHEKKELRPLPTGDGMAVVFSQDPVAPARCALEVSASLKLHPEVELRMGINTGLAAPHADIKKEE